MAWEWEYHSNPQRWTLTVGEWRAVVERVHQPRYGWRPHVERVTPPEERHDGPVDKDPMRARTWCLTRIATLRSSGKDRL
jgi:hypothetical protein